MIIQDQNVLISKNIGKTEWKILFDKSNDAVLLSNSSNSWLAQYASFNRKLVCNSFPFKEILLTLEREINIKIK
jgi:hypothetical protein